MDGPTPTPGQTLPTLVQTFGDKTTSAGSYRGAVKEVYECAYARTLSSAFCVLYQASVVYPNGIVVTSTASRRSATIRMAITLSSPYSDSIANLVNNVDAAILVAQMSQVNDATGNRMAVPSRGDLSLAAPTYSGSPTPTTASGSESDSTLWIIIGLAGGVAGLCLLGICIFCVCRGRKATKGGLPPRPPSVPLQEVNGDLPPPAFRASLQPSVPGVMLELSSLQRLPDRLRPEPFLDLARQT